MSALYAAGVMMHLTKAGLDPHQIARWLDTPRLELAGDTPRLALVDGRGERVLRLATSSYEWVGL